MKSTVTRAKPSFTRLTFDGGLGAANVDETEIERLTAAGAAPKVAVWKHINTVMSAAKQH